MLGLGESLLEVFSEKLCKEGERFRSCVKLGEIKVGRDIGRARGCMRGSVIGLVRYCARDCVRW